MTRLDAPFPWFGGKRKVASLVWERFGSVANYVEPFFGSGAVLLGRPRVEGIETINDADGCVANFWRAIKLAPDETAEWADNPVNENDLHARQTWLLKYLDVLPSKLEADPEWCDPKIAGWWCWGICCWIGSEWCSGKGPWHVVDGQLIDTKNPIGGVSRQLPHLGDAGRGINRHLPYLRSGGQGINRKRPYLRGKDQQYGQGIHALKGCDSIQGWFSALSERLRYVRVCCGDWTRECGPSPTFKRGLTAVLLDPPYGEGANRVSNLYRVDDASQLSTQVRDWAVEVGRRDDMRIALCGYEGEYEMPGGWDCMAWNAGEGYGAMASERSNNGKRERIWFSRACVAAKQGRLAL